MSHASSEEAGHEPGERRLLEKEATRKHDAGYLEALAARKYTTTDGDQPGGSLCGHARSDASWEQGGGVWPQVGCEGLSRAGHRRE